MNNKKLLPIYRNTIFIQIIINVFSYKMNSLNSMPVIFFGHGNPMNGIEDNKVTREWTNLMKPIRRPRAILSISAHWETHQTRITSNSKQKTIHDFGGFPRELHNVQYNPNGDEKLVGRIKELLPEVVLDDSWGLDHGTWTILRNIYPKADVPVVQLSIDMNKTMQQHFELAKKLRPLRDEDILIMGSGNIVHNLRKMDWGRETGFPWAVDFNENVKSAVLKKDYASVVDFQKMKVSRESAPTPEHFIPLIYILGLQRENESSRFFTDFLELGSVSMTGVIIQ